MKREENNEVILAFPCLSQDYQLISKLAHRTNKTDEDIIKQLIHIGLQTLALQKQIERESI